MAARIILRSAAKDTIVELINPVVIIRSSLGGYGSQNAAREMKRAANNRR